MRVVSEQQLARELARFADRTPRIVVGGNAGTPRALLAMVDAALPSYRLFAMNAQPGFPDRDGVVHETPFVGAGVRRSARLAYLPARLSLVPMLFASSHVPDVVLVQTTPPDGGQVSLGIEVNILPAAVEQARRSGGLVVAQLNPSVPWTYGDAELSVDDVDLAVEVSEPLPEAGPRRLDDTAAAIGDRVAALVPDGATLQLGIGAVPDATLLQLTGRRGLRIWSEMFSDGVLHLERRGALDPDVPLVTSFLIGSPDLYAWLDRNERVRMLRTEATNDPGRIAQQQLMTSVNSALQVDLYAQANASWAGHWIHSGIGGQTDFVVGALHAAGGQAVIALPSWHPKVDRSTVVPLLDAPATSFQHSWVVTEQGAASVWGCSSRDQAAHLVAVAHPDARAGLTEAGRARGLLS